MSEIKLITQKINAWIKERDWEKAQKPKDLAISLCLEAAEVLEHFQWKNERKSWQHVRENKEDVADELADVAIYLFKLAHKVKVDLAQAIDQKLVKASKKYPAAQVKHNTSEYYRIKKAARASRSIVK